jgi:hypothetical protein
MLIRGGDFVPIEFGVWRVDNAEPVKVSFSTIGLETELEDILTSNIDLLGLDVLVIGRQVKTAYGKKTDLLAVDAEGDLHIIELKKAKTARDIVGQVLDYASWVTTLSYDDIAGLYAEYNMGDPFESAFADRFGTSPPEAINEQHHLVIVASELDPSTERIVNYLADEIGLLVNTIFFRYFEDQGHRYLARTWLIDPAKAEVQATKGPSGKKAKEPWNGQDFYVSFGEGEHRRWDEARRFGFVSGGGGKWYSQSLKQLFPGARVFVRIPKVGYVGVGTVEGSATPVSDFTVPFHGKQTPILDAGVKAPKMGDGSDDPDISEWLVSVDWTVTRPIEEAFWVPGLVANANTAAKLRNRFTIETLTEEFGLDDD